MTKDWYRNKKWDANIEEDFETHLKRARGTFSKAQYLRIQGITLLDTTEDKTRLQGIRLLQRLIEEYPMEEMEIYSGHESLGDYYLEAGAFEKAEYHFRIALVYSKTEKRSGTSGMIDLKLAETILKGSQHEKLDEAYKYVVKYPKQEFGFNSQRFYHANLGALLCDKMQKKDKAKEFALKALELSEITKPDFYRHPTLGLAEASEKQIMILQEIVNRV